MPDGGDSRRMLDVPALPRFGVWGHVILVAAFAFISVGQLMFVLHGRAETSGGAYLSLTTFLAALLVGVCYLNLYLLAPRLLLKERYVEYLSALFGAIFVYIVVKWAVEVYLLSRAGIAVQFNAVTLLDWLSSIFMYAVSLMSTSAVILFRQWVADTQKINDLENSRLQSSVDRIKKSIDAPVLYRVLGYAAKNVKRDPEKVSGIIFKLSEKLRRDLYDDLRQ